MSALTDENIKAEKFCRETIRAMGETQRRLIVRHLSDLQSFELERLISQTDPVRMHRSQGGVTAMQSVIDLFANPDKKAD